MFIIVMYKGVMFLKTNRIWPWLLALALAAVVKLMGVGESTEPQSILSSLPAASMLELPPMKYVYAGGSNTMAIDIHDDLWVWGLNLGGLVVASSLQETFYQPVWYAAGVQSARSSGFSCAMLKKDGTLWTWGSNSLGNLGDGTINNTSQPTMILDQVKSFDFGSYSGVAVKTDGSLWTWGFQGPTIHLVEIDQGKREKLDIATVPLAPTKIMDDVKAAAIGQGNFYAIKSDGTLWSWGANDNGQLGDGTTDDRPEPKMIMENVKLVEAVMDRCVAVKEDGSLWIWGSPELYSQLGLGEERRRDMVTIPEKLLDDVQAIDLSRDTGTALKIDNSLWVWGENGRAEEIKDPIYPENRTLHVPKEVEQNVKSVSSDTLLTYYIKEDGTLWSWGMAIGPGRKKKDYGKPFQIVYGIR